MEKRTEQRKHFLHCNIAGFIVNTLTGEKSGEMLVSVRLQEEAGE